MSIIRALLLVVLVLTAPLAVSGFWSDHALADSQGYAEAMKEAWKNGDIQGEVNELLTTATTEQIYDYFNVSGPDQSFLADAALGYATNTVQGALASGAFTNAWTEWHYAVHEDLAAIVKGQTPPGPTSVDGPILTLDITPLASVLLSGTVGQLVQQVLGEDLLVRQIDTGYDMEAQLDSLGHLWSLRWWMAGASLLALAALLWFWRPPLRAAAMGLFAAAAGCCVAGLWRAAAGSGARSATGQTSPTDLPNLSAAVSEALTGSWSTWLFTAAVVFALLGGGMLALHLKRRPDTGAPPAAAAI